MAYQVLGTFDVDLKWSLWSKHAWGDEAAKVWRTLSTMPIVSLARISTAPRKEIRFGDVTVYRDAEDVWRADVTFSEEWDEADELADEGEDVASVEALLPRTDYGAIGLTRRETCTAKTWAALAAKIDKVEDRLIVDGQKAWKAFDARPRGKEKTG